MQAPEQVEQVLALGAPAGRDTAAAAAAPLSEQREVPARPRQQRHDHVHVAQRGLEHALALCIGEVRLDGKLVLGSVDDELLQQVEVGQVVGVPREGDRGVGDRDRSAALGACKLREQQADRRGQQVGVAVRRHDAKVVQPHELLQLVVAIGRDAQVQVEHEQPVEAELVPDGVLAIDVRLVHDL